MAASVADEVALPLLMAGRHGDSQGADAAALEPIDPRSDASSLPEHQKSVSAVDTAKTADDSGVAAWECPTNESGADLGEPPAALRDPDGQPGGAMALGLSRRRSSMMIPAPQPAAVR